MLCIKNGNIHNGIKEEAFVADILVENGKIKEIGENLIFYLHRRFCYGTSFGLDRERQLRDQRRRVGLADDYSHSWYGYFTYHSFEGVASTQIRYVLERNDYPYRKEHR